MWRNFIITCFIIAMPMLLLSSTHAEYSENLGESLNAQTVKIKVKHGDGVEIGSGVLLCQKDDQTYILTAKHVLYDISGKMTKCFKDTSTVTVEFYKDILPAIESNFEDLKIHYSENKDVALMRITVKKKPDSLKFALVRKSANIKAFQNVYTTGHPVGQKDWSAQSGEVNKVGEFITYTNPRTANIETGYSGGPLVNQYGELIGINIRIRTSEGGSVYTDAIPINEIRNILDPWMDLNWLQWSTRPDESQVVLNTSSVEVVDIKSDFTEKPKTVRSMLIAKVVVRNKVSKALNLEYKFSWFDKNGNEIDPGSGAWTPIMLNKKSSATLQGVAPNPGAIDFKIEISEQ